MSCVYCYQKKLLSKGLIHGFSLEVASWAEGELARSAEGGRILATARTAFSTLFSGAGIFIAWFSGLRPDC